MKAQLEAERQLADGVPIVAKSDSVTLFDANNYDGQIINKKLQPDRKALYREDADKTLTDIQQHILLLKIRGISDVSISKNQFVSKTDIHTQLYSCFENLHITAPREAYDSEMALTQAGLRAIRTKQISLSEIAKDFNLRNAALLDKTERHAWNLVINNDGAKSAEEIALLMQTTKENVDSLFRDSRTMMEAATPAQAAIFYLAYIKDQSLTVKEKQVCDQLIKFYITLHDIAGTMYITESTIKTHARSIYAKLGVSSKRQLIDFYRSTNKNADPFNKDNKEPNLPVEKAFYTIIAEPITKTEAIVLHKMLSGMTNKEIATHLGISVNTVRTHISHIYQKVGVAGRKGHDNFQILMQAYENASSSASEARRRTLVNTKHDIYTK